MQKELNDSDVSFWKRMDELIGDERPYPWAEKIGINRSAFQSARTRGKKPLPKTVKVWAEKIGCDYDWLNNGDGVAFPIYDYDQIINRQIDQALDSLEESYEPENMEEYLNEHPDVIEQVNPKVVRRDDEAEKRKFANRKEYISSDGMSLYYLQEAVRVYRDISRSARSSERSEFENGYLYLNIYEYLIGRIEGKLCYPVEIAFTIVENALKKLPEDKKRLSNKDMATIIFNVSVAVPYKVLSFLEKFCSKQDKQFFSFHDTGSIRAFIQKEWDEEIFQLDVLKSLEEETLQYYEHLMIKDN